MNSTITVYINSSINEIFGKFEMKQTFKNDKENPIELNIEIPIAKGMYLNQIKYKFNGKEYISKIYPKEKAKEKYTDAISEGNNAIYCKYDEENSSYILKIGYLEPNSIIEFESIFYCLVNSFNNQYSFSLYKIYPNDYNYSTIYHDDKCQCEFCIKGNKRIKADIKIKTISKIININSSDINNNYERIIFKYQSENEVNINYLKINRKITSSSDNDNNYIDNKINNKESIIINFFTEEKNKENILFYQFDPILNKTTYLLRINKTENKELKIDNILSNLKENKLLYFIINKKEINYIYYCLILPCDFAYKEIINKEIKYKEYKFENGYELNKILMSVYLNENDIENELKLSKEYQILSKNSYLFLKYENENIISEPNISSYTYSRKKKNFIPNSSGFIESEIENLFSFSGSSNNKNLEVNKEDKNENSHQNLIEYNSEDYKFLPKYLLKNEWYDEKIEEFCKKCNMGKKLNREHIINECSFYSKWREKCISQIKELYKLYENELNLEMNNYNLGQLIDDLFFELFKINKSRQNYILEILDNILSGFQNV